jgi:quinol monooxygenase YgiN
METTMSHYHNSDAPHWYCHVGMDVIDVEAARAYLQEQTKIEDANGMLSFEYFVDDLEHPSRVVLLECFAGEPSQKAHIENVRMDTFARVFTNFSLDVYGNVPQSGIERMAEAGFWPPTFAGTFRHMPYFMGFRRD